MSNVYEQAEVLTSLLVLGGATDIPDHSGILDRALGEVGQGLPAPLKLTFATTSVGFRCFELPDIILACHETGLVEWQHGDMRVLKLRLPIEHAFEIAFTNLSIASYQETGQTLVAALENAEYQAAKISSSR
ncbi:hypothetical protein [Rhizobium sp. MHM7A]|uniref:hypothetical protein n=1 Tax=Rhizobium sp. MHM7A TaxID=2583233 RepID=UPI00110613AF|nr:hypothetical protein [Rhizobium sp. MHM7A]TLX17048.1 hypothetical protein FFR93_06960 [Rhizobium sp. MHM7A]